MINKSDFDYTGTIQKQYTIRHTDIANKYMNDIFAEVTFKFQVYANEEGNLDISETDLVKLITDWDTMISYCIKNRMYFDIKLFTFVQLEDRYTMHDELIPIGQMIYDQRFISFVGNNSFIQDMLAAIGITSIPIYRLLRYGDKYNPFDGYIPIETMSTYDIVCKFITTAETFSQSAYVEYGGNNLIGYKNYYKKDYDALVGLFKSCNEVERKRINVLASVKGDVEIEPEFVTPTGYSYNDMIEDLKLARPDRI